MCLILIKFHLENVMTYLSGPELSRTLHLLPVSAIQLSLNLPRNKLGQN